MALAQARARRLAELRAEPTAGTPAEGASAPGGPEAFAAGAPAGLSRAALEAQALAAEAARAQAEARAAEVRRRQERAEALLAVERALLRHAAPAPSAPGAGAPDAAAGLLADLRSGDPARVGPAVKALAAGPEGPLLEVAARPRDRADSLAPALALVEALPADHAQREPLGLALLEAATPAEALAVARVLMPDAALLAAALEAGAARAAAHLLALAPLDGLSDSLRERLGRAVAARLEAGDPDGVAAALAARLADPATGPALVAALQAEPGPTTGRRAALLHALARTGAPPEARAWLTGRLEGWLLDPEPRVAVAALLLAERILGRALPFDPWASVAERAAALEALPPGALR